jgi:hypothetical protein
MLFRSSVSGRTETSIMLYFKIKSFNSFLILLTLAFCAFVSFVSFSLKSEICFLLVLNSAYKSMYFFSKTTYSFSTALRVSIRSSSYLVIFFASLTELLPNRMLSPNDKASTTNSTFCHFICLKASILNFKFILSIGQIKFQILKDQFKNNI